MTVVLGASAILAFVQDERGAEAVETAFGEGAVCGAANWSAVAQKVISAGGDWNLVKALLRSYGLTVEPVLADDAEWAALRWRSGEGLSLGDRLCLAVAQRLDCSVLTADEAWGSSRRIRQIR